MTSCSSLVEIKCEETLAFYTGYVKDVERDQVLVAYEGGWQRDAWLSIHSIRPSLSGFHPAQFLPSPGDVVEVKAKSAEHEPYSWWRGSVKSVRPNPAALESDELPDSLGSNNRALIYEISYAGWENEFTETLEKEMLRPFNKHPCFNAGEIEKHSLPIAPQLVPLLNQEVLGPVHFDARTLAIIVEPAGTVPHVAPQNQGFVAPPQPLAQPRIQVIGEKQACQRAVILLAQLLPRLLQQLEQQQAAQQAQHQAYMQQHDRPSYAHDHRSHDRFDHGGSHRDPLASHHHKQPLPQSHHHAYQHQQHHNQHDGFGHQMGRGGAGGDDAFPPSHNYPSSSLPYAGGLNSSSPPLSLTFHCPPQLMGMVIGKRHKNLYIAENLEGIHKVHVDTETGNIVVIARTMEAAQAARSLLELTEQTLHIPSVLVGRVVGKNFQTIKTIEQHSGVLRIKVGDDRDADMEALQQMALHGIPGLSNVDEQGNPLPNPAALALQAAQSAEKETKRSAFDRPYQYHRGDRRGGRDGRSGGGRDDEPEEFDIVALEDDKTVEISIIGSPATVSEAELLLRTHIGLITQIYKLSYDEAMLERQVHALNQICPVKLMLGGDARGYHDRGYDDNARDSRGSGGSFMHQGRGRGGDRDRGHGHGGQRGHSGKDDKFMPAWMNDAPAMGSGQGQGQGQQHGAGNDGGQQQRRRQAADPSVDIHAARLQGAGAGAGMPVVNNAPMQMQSTGPSYKSAALIGASTVAASAAPSAGLQQQQQQQPIAAANGTSGDAASGDDDDGSIPRRRGGRKEKEKQQRRDQRNTARGGPANPAGAGTDGQPQQPQQQQRGRGRGGNNQNNRRQNDNGAAAAAGAATAPVGGQ